MTKNKPLFWALMTIVAEMILIALVLPSHVMDSINDMEYGWMQSTYSEGSLAWLDKETDDLQYLMTRESGLADYLQWMFFPSEEARSREVGMARLGQNFWFPYLESRGKALDEMLKTLLMRLGSIFLWLPLILLTTVPAIVDGIMERKIKQHTFMYASPLIYKYGVRTVILTSFLTSACILSPVPVPPLLLPLSLMGCVGVMGITVIGNMPKRL